MPVKRVLHRPPMVMLAPDSAIVIDIHAGPGAHLPRRAHSHEQQREALMLALAWRTVPFAHTRYRV